MRLPRLDPQKNYDGLYVVDFGDAAAVGYTAEEVGVLLESDKYRDVRVYKVHRMHPDGTVELKGVASRRFDVESAFVFCSRDADRARKDFDDLTALAESDPLPCKARLLYGQLGYQPQFPWVAALLYPAEYEDELSAWLLKHDVQAGETVDAGISHATVVAANLQVRDRAQLACRAWRESRDRDEVFRSVGRAVQR
ncbi:MAG: hypothetical protein JXL80_11505 [Planctomycetes bacterium]|nr:hypothetical protein [Planctomycetota bacterium]